MDQIQTHISDMVINYIVSTGKFKMKKLTNKTTQTWCM